jgi:hypothetical protein
MTNGEWPMTNDEGLRIVDWRLAAKAIKKM